MFSLTTLNVEHTFLCIYVNVNNNSVFGCYVSNINRTDFGFTKRGGLNFTWEQEIL